MADIIAHPPAGIEPAAPEASDEPHPLPGVLDVVARLDARLAEARAIAGEAARGDADMAVIARRLFGLRRDLASDTHGAIEVAIAGCHAEAIRTGADDGDPDWIATQRRIWSAGRIGDKTPAILPPMPDLDAPVGK